MQRCSPLVTLQPPPPFPGARPRGLLASAHGPPLTPPPPVCCCPCAPAGVCSLTNACTARLCTATPWCTPPARPAPSATSPTLRPSARWTPCRSDGWVDGAAALGLLGARSTWRHAHADLGQKWATVFGPQFLVFGLVWATRRLEAAPTVLTTHAFSKHNQACRLAAGRPCMQGGAAGTHGRNGQLQAPSFGRAGAALPAAPRPPRLLHSAAAM